MPNTSSHFISPLDLSILDGIIGVTFKGIAAGEQSGWSVASAGDVNGDGFDDVVIGAPYASSGNLSNAGSTYLIFGHTGTWDPSLALGSLNGTNGFFINGVAENDRSGWSVASAGDVNGDGISDVVIGAYNATPGGLTGAGSTYLIFGHRGVWGSPLALSSLNGTNGVVINGIAVGGNSGWSVASAGDVNGDGISDLLIGADAAAAYLIFGHQGVWSSPLSLLSLNGINGLDIAGDYSGRSVALAGDVNGDGIDDIVISNLYASPGNLSEAGSTYLIFGHGGIWSSPLSLGSLNGINGIVINGIAASDYSGTSVASAGDVNGDGINDIVIGAWGARPGGLTGVGSTYLIFGQRGAWSSPFSLGSLNGINGVAINGFVLNGQSGFSVAGAGDVNGDGIHDMVISIAYSSENSAYLIFGYAGTWNSPLTLSSLNGTNGVIMNGGDGGEFSVAGAGDVNGDGISDMVIGARGASPGTLSFAGSTYLVFGDSLELLANTLIIRQGETIFLNNSMLAAINRRNPAMNASISFSITNVMHGSFSRSRFFQSDLSQNLISFTHDNSIYAPSYEVTAVGNRVTTDPVAALINFNVPPVLTVNPLFIGQGQTIVLTSQIIRATSVYYLPDGLMFSVSNVSYGSFVRTNTTIPENQFNQSVLTGGQIAFATDGSAHAPSYNISVSDGASTTPAMHGIVNFNQAPILLSNRLTLTPGQQKVLLSSNELSANDAETSFDRLTFTPSMVNCHFENINLPGIVLPVFLQENVQNAQIVFVWDGHTLPAYNMSLSDGMLSAGRPASINILSESNITRTVINNTDSTNTGAIAGGLVGALAGLGLLFGLQWYLKKKTNNQLQKILLEGTSDAEKAFNRDVVRPIANKIFDVINTTGCFGQRSEADTKAYMMAIEKIISELRRQNANLDFNAMEPVDKESFINEIANQTRQQSLPKHKGFSFGSCTRYFKAEVTPQEIEYAAESIALASSVWQSRHMGGVSAKSTHLGLELGKLSSIGFPIEAANEGVPLEKQFKLMQNHVKAVEQREQKQQQELKRLAEQLALREAEIAVFKQQSGGAMAIRT